MRKMKCSGVEWIGDIPDTWDVTILSALFGERKQKNIGLIESNLLSLSYGNIKRKNIDTNEGLLPASFETYNIVEQGDIVFRLTDLQNDKRSLRTGLCRERGIITSAYVTLYRKAEDDPAYMHYLFHAYDICKVFYGMGDGVRQGMNYDDLKSLRVIRPPVDVQKRIADYLDAKCAKIDALIAKQQEIIEKLKAYKLSVITEAVTKGLNPNVPMKDSGIKYVAEIPPHWENRKMISILSMRVVDGPHESPELFDEGIPYISATAIENGKINFSKMRGYISEEYCDQCDQRYKPQLNDILVIKLGASTGQVAMVETTERFNIWVPLAVVRCNQEANSRFVYYAFQSDYFIKQMEQSWTYGTQQTLGVKTIERLRILLPTLSEQQKIVEYLDKKDMIIRQEIERRQKIIDKLTEYKKSRIYEVVTGKQEVH